MTTISIDKLSDRELLDRIVQTAGEGRRVTADLLALIGECDARRLYLGEGCSSLFTYCTQVLQLSAHSAYHRIEGARAARQFPIILELVSSGSVTLTTVALLRPYLTLQNHRELLAAATHRTKREVEHQIACLKPVRDAETTIRRLPGAAAPGSLPAAAAASVAAPAAVSAGAAEPTPWSPAVDSVSPLRAEPRPQVRPLSADRYLVRVTLSAGGHEKLRRAQDLLGHRVAGNDPAAIIEKALSLLVEHLERAKLAMVQRPRHEVASPIVSASTKGSRQIPAAVRRQVWARDEGRCAFVGGLGRCTETGRLEFHHIVPFARGGSTSVANLALRCSSHNRYEAQLAFGDNDIGTSDSFQWSLAKPRAKTQVVVR